MASRYARSDPFALSGTALGAAPSMFAGCAAQRSHLVRSVPGGNRSRIARRSVSSAARLMALPSMAASIGQLAPMVTTEFRARSSRNKADQRQSQNFWRKALR
jgi:hypothetical protein